MIGSLDITVIVIVFIVLVVSITVHEAMHAFTSNWLGDDTAHREGRITLNPIKHIDPFATLLLPFVTLVLFQVPLLAAKPVPFNPSRVRFEEFGAALVGIAGPLTNLVLAIIGGLLLNVFHADISLGMAQVLGIFVIINLGLFIFNMVPIPPLDGSRLLYAFAPESLQRFMAGLEQIGIFIIFGLVLAVPAFGELLVQLNQNLLELLLLPEAVNLLR